MVNQIGVIQGRLTNPYGRRGIQFPIHGDEIIKEFEIVKSIGLDYIEWTIPKGKYNLFLGDFYAQEALKNLVEIGVPIKSIDLDYLKDPNLNNDSELYLATSTINWIANIASNIGCKILSIPIYEKNMDILRVRPLISFILDRTYLRVVFEFLDVNSFTGINFINDLCYADKLSFRDNNNRIGCCFDIGNNYDRDIIGEMKNYNKNNMLYHIHIKDKNSKGESVPLGKGVINWILIFNWLKSLNYKGNFTLQIARDKDGQEIETVKKQIKFVKDSL